MRTTFALPAVGLLLMSLISPLWAQDVQICTIDNYYKGLWGNSDIDYDASTFCHSILGASTVTTCYSTSVTRTTTMPNADTTITVTRTTSIPASTTTVTTTVIVFGAVSTTTASPTPSMTAKVKYVRQAMEEIAKRQAMSNSLVSTSRTSIDTLASLASACTCNPLLSSDTSSILCTSTSTVTNVVSRRTTSTTYQTITSGVTTVTSTVNQTATISSTYTSPVTTTTWTVTLSSSSSSSTTMSSSTMTPTTSTTTSMSGTTATSTTTNTAVPSGCPYINGTRFSNDTKDCTFYERICFLTYADSDFYDAEYNFATPEECAALCDAQNRGMNTVCLGIVWNTTTVTGANCRQLKKLSTPSNDTNSIAIILQKDPQCNTTSSTTSMISTSTSTLSMTTTAPTTSNNNTSMTTTTTTNGTTFDPTLISTTTSTSSSTSSGNTTTTSTSTPSSTSSNGNVTTSCAPSTIYATQFQTVTATLSCNDSSNSWAPWQNMKRLKTVTQYVTANGTTFTTTVTASDNNTVTKTETVTTTSDYNSTVTVTKNETQTVTQSYFATVTITASTSCPALPTSRNRKHSTSSSTPLSTTTSTTSSAIPSTTPPTTTITTSTSANPVSPVTTESRVANWMA